jgi:hypothetical protein
MNLKFSLSRFENFPVGARTGAISILYIVLAASYPLPIAKNIFMAIRTVFGREHCLTEGFNSPYR